MISLFCHDIQLLRTAREKDAALLGIAHMAELGIALVSVEVCGRSIVGIAPPRLFGAVHYVFRLHGLWSGHTGRALTMGGGLISLAFTGFHTTHHRLRLSPL